MEREIKSHSVRIRLSVREFDALTAFSREAGLTVSEVLRRLGREASGLGPVFQGEAALAIRAQTEQLRKAAVNLNQLAKSMNSGRNPRYGHLTEGIDRLRRIVELHRRELMAMCEHRRNRALARMKRHG